MLLRKRLKNENNLNVISLCVVGGVFLCYLNKINF